MMPDGTSGRASISNTRTGVEADCFYDLARRHGRTH
jgi:hypothetical protein